TELLELSVRVSLNLAALGAVLPDQLRPRTRTRVSAPSVTRHSLDSVHDPLRRGEGISHSNQRPCHPAGEAPIAQVRLEVGEVVAVLGGQLVYLVERVERLVAERVGDLAGQLGFGLGKEPHDVPFGLDAERD